MATATPFDTEQGRADVWAAMLERSKERVSEPFVPANSDKPRIENPADRYRVPEKRSGYTGYQLPERLF